MLVLTDSLSLEAFVEQRMMGVGGEGGEEGGIVFMFIIIYFVTVCLEFLFVENSFRFLVGGVNELE